jgi:hypothetical protein
MKVSTGIKEQRGSEGKSNQKENGNAETGGFEMRDRRIPWNRVLTTSRGWRMATVVRPAMAPATAFSTGHAIRASFARFCSLSFDLDEIFLLVLRLAQSLAINRSD